MSRFEQVAQEVVENPYLAEWYEKIQTALDDYRPATPTVDDIIGTVAFQMLKRCGDMQIPTENDRAFFAKILWVTLVRRKGGGSVDDLYPRIEENLAKRIHKKQVEYMIKNVKNYQL